MIDYINGTLKEKSPDNIIVEAAGIGYKIAVSISMLSKLPQEGMAVKIFIVEAVAGMYGGVINLYGFLTNEERDMYLLIKDEVPSTGAKKAMEYIDKISKSFADFKTAVSSKNAAMLNTIFGFRKPTADKLIAALKDKIAQVSVLGEEKWSNINKGSNQLIEEAISALVALGYKDPQARAAVNAAYDETQTQSLEALVKKSLQFKD
ncbi:MAG: Holliday junction branch migration protein RuvA [Elusimicrobiota bacterium]|jgi:Holliday junction DNA helicase RuvA|nr:Holliday junction branch migration protein RuvA [Elusimicrobiota bacterium]